MNSPTAVAVSTLFFSLPYSEPMLHNFFVAGGVHAVLRVLREWSDPNLIGYAVGLILRILDDPEPRTVKWRQQLTRHFHRSGKRSSHYCTCTRRDP